MIATAFASLLTPVGLVTAGVAAFAVELASLAGLAGRVAGVVKETWGNMRSSLDTCIEGMSKALKNGNLDVAARIGFLGLQVEWLQGIKTLAEIWGALIAEMTQTWRGFVGLIKL